MRRIQLVRLPLALAAIAAVALAGCGGSKAPQTKTDAPATAPASAQPAPPAPKQPKAGGTLTVGLNGEIDKIHPLKSTTIVGFQVYTQIYEGLVRANPKLDGVVPLLAESWDVSADGKTYTFQLRRGVKFHNGKEFKAEDVKFTFDVMMAKETGSPRAGDFRPVDKVEVVDDATVRFTLKHAFAPFLTKLEVMRILPKMEGHDFDRNPIGTGPFQFVEWVSGQRIVVKKFNEYWGGAPYLDQVVFRPIPEAATKLVELKTGNVDILNEVPFKDIKGLEQEPGIKVHRTNSVVRDHLGFNVTRPPFNNKLVRQAIAWAIDRKTIAEALMYGFAKPTNTPVPAGHWAYQPDSVNRYGYDLNKAKSLLAQAGFPNGFETTVKVSPTYPEEVKMAELLQQSLAQIGVKLKVEQLEWSTWIKTVVSEKNFDMEIVLISGGVDPDDFLYQWYHTGEVFNFLGYSNPEYDKMVEEARALSSQDQRKQAYLKIQDFLMEEAPVAHIIYRDAVMATSDKVQGFVMTPRYDMDFRKVWLDK